MYAKIIWYARFGDIFKIKKKSFVLKLKKMQNCKYVKSKTSHFTLFMHIFIYFSKDCRL